MSLGTLALTISLAAAASAGGAEISAPRLRFRPILFDTVVGPVAAERGTLRVRESRTSGSRRRVRLAVVRFAATTSLAGAPIVLLEGGPGSSGLETAAGRRYELIDRLRRHGDVIVFDQRGVGSSKPRLSCAESADIDPGQVLTEAGWIAGVDGPSRRCADDWRARGVDLDAYNTRENADDVDELRAALGVERIVLWGVSYGTQLALTVMRRHPETVERAILHGVLGPDQYLVLPRTFDGVLRRLGRMAAQQGTYTDTVAALRRVLGRLQAAPARVTLQDPDTQLPIEVAVGPYEVRLIIDFVVFGNRSLMGMLPGAIAQADAGDLSSFARLGLEMRRFEPFAMRMAMACTTPVNQRRQRKIDQQAPRSILGALPDVEDVCEAWGVPPLDDGFLDPVVSDVPTLLISATLDSATPVANATSVGKRLSDSQQLVLVGGTHSDLVHGDPRILDAIDEFLSGHRLGTTRLVLPPWAFTQ